MQTEKNIPLGKIFGAFTYSNSQIDAVVRYILNQPEHNKKTSFKDEFFTKILLLWSNIEKYVMTRITENTIEEFSIELLD